LPVALDESPDGSPTELAASIRFLGLPQSLSQQIDPELASENLIPLTTPIGGVVTHREVAAGEVVSPAETLFTVTDTTQMWLTLDVRLEDARHLAIGRQVRFLADGSTEEAVGEISWISTGVDSRTRTVKVRAELPNPDGRLRDETFGSGRIILREQPDAIVVPNEAVHWEGCCHVVFVRDKAFLDDESYKVFHTRSVRPAVKTPKVTEIAAGLLPGEVIATVGSGALAAELLRGNLGAG
jgi:cobalt-zinc-cadmium efflux system membrane fusion protein